MESMIWPAAETVMRKCNCWEHREWKWWGGGRQGSPLPCQGQEDLQQICGILRKGERQGVCQARECGVGEISISRTSLWLEQRGRVRGSWEFKQRQFGGESCKPAGISDLVQVLSHLFLHTKLRQSTNNPFKFPDDPKPNCWVFQTEGGA